MARVFGQGDCLCQVVNTCGSDILSEYDLYDPYAGRFLTTWGEFDLPWSDTDQAWKTAVYNKTNGYVEGDRVVYPAEYGTLLLLLEANQDVPVPVGALDPSKWTEICRIRTTDLSYLPSYAELLTRYKYYDNSLYLESWSEFSSSWSSALTDQDSDVWSDAKIRKELLYVAGDVVLYDSGCSDYTCVYVALSDVPALAVPGPPPPPYWQRLYCVPTGRESTCKKVKKCGPGRALVSLSSQDNDLICVPVESKVGVGPRR
jgi:hypothetical protein